MRNEKIVKQEVLTIQSNGTFAVNMQLLSHFEDFAMQVRIRKDGSQIVLLKNSENAIYVGENGRVKNYDIVEKIKRTKSRFPAYYVGDRDNEEKVWVGIYADKCIARMNALNHEHIQQLYRRYPFEKYGDRCIKRICNKFRVQYDSYLYDEC